ncbi:MAG TPA: arylesterase [Desulfuromonadales bacterium]|nr:arylesterase [Desulfuromonadales bacterium]
MRHLFRAATLRWVLLFAATVLLQVSCSETPALPAIPQDGVILAFGDSITFGTGAAEGESYPAVLARLSGRRVVNAGIPGEVSAAGTARLPEVLERERPALLILCHGGNDMLARQDQRQIADNLRSMLRMARERGVPVILVAVPTPDLSLKPPALYGEVASEFGVPIDQKSLPRILGTGSLKSDYIHPNAKGYAILAEALAGLMKKNGALK